MTSNAKFLVVPTEVRFTSVGAFGGWCFVWLDILYEENLRNTPQVPFGWHVKFFPPEVSIDDIFTRGYFTDHLNWTLVCRKKDVSTRELESLARRFG